jgi:N-acetylneuraminic acid mutarotase
MNNRLYAIGGRENTTEINAKTKDSLAVYTIEEYDIENNKWTIKSILPFKHFTIGAVALNNKIYILSDTTNNSMSGSSAILEEYDPANGTFNIRANLFPSKCDATMVALNNKIYLLGGCRNGALSSVEEYDPIINKWVEKDGLPYNVQNHQAVTMNNEIYISGGITYSENGGNEKKANMLVYKPKK